MTSDPRADALRSGYAPIAQAYREQLSGELAGKSLDRAFLDAFAERTAGTHILDVGCGPGHVASYLESRCTAVEGVDLSPEMVAQAIATHPTITFRIGDMFALPCETGAFGGIVAFYAIVHLQAAELVAPFVEFHRVLAPGGLVAVAFHIGSETVHVEELFGAATSLDFVMHEPEAVTGALGAAGFASEARLDREPYPGAEHQSRRCYLLARR